MSYRGRDLDLRTAEPARPRQSAEQLAFDQTSAPILYVDDAVLACCNHAYDLALAYRAPEVRLEHLLNAMTRTDAAVDVMALQGIDVAGLRRDTAAVIAAEAPIIHATERSAPRRSPELAEALHMAARLADLRRGPISVSDLLKSLLELNREQLGLVMLKRNAPGWTSRGLGEPPRADALPPLLGGAYQLDPRYAAPEQRPSEWMRLPPAPAYYQAAPAVYPSPQPGYFVPDPLSQPPAPSGYYVPEPMQTPPAGGSMADVVQNSRLDQLERTIRDLSGELVAERRAYGQLVGDMKRDAPAPIEMGQRYATAQDDQQSYMMRGDTGPVGSQMADRLGHLERNIDAKLSDIARVWSTLGDRLQALEQAVVTVRSESSVPQGLVERFDGLDEVLPTLTKISERLTGLERQQSAKPTASVAINLQPIIERLEAIEQAQTLRPAATTQALAPVIERLAAIERGLAQRSGNATVDLAPVFERLTTIDKHVTEVSRGASTLGDRIGQFERKLDAGSSTSDRAATQLSERLRAIEEAVTAQRNQVAQLTTTITADVKALGQTVGQSLAGQGSNGERIQSLTSNFERQRTEAGQTMSGIGDKIAGLEKVMQSFGQRTLELHSAHGKDLVELHNALIKLNTNQQTLAASMDQWRLDNGTELSTLTSRFESVERSTARPVQLLETLQDNVQILQRSSAKRDEQKSRFRHWLMGTDDWYGASWEEPDPKDGKRAPNGTVSAASPAASTSASISPARPASNPSNPRK